MTVLTRGLSFEQGPIRPPSEASSLLLRFTRNCPWNKCTFCPVYKGTPFERRSLREIKKDIDAVAQIIDEIKALSWSLGEGGEVTEPVVRAIMTSNTAGHCHRHVAAWLYWGTGHVFIQDANSLIMKTDDLAEALRYLKERIRGITRITSYARSSTLSRKSLEELKILKEAGLSRIHVGMESGSDKVLAFVKKGATAKQHVDAGLKVIEAGMTLSEYIMPGLGGKEMTFEHAVETARVLNEINPHFIRLRSLRIPPVVPLYEDVQKGRFTPLHDDEVVREIRIMIERLEGVTSTLTSDHIMNLLEEVQGTFPEDKPKMLAVIDEYLELPEHDKLLFRLGRRGGTLRSIRQIYDPDVRSRLEVALKELTTETGFDVETLIKELADRYI
ncbi:radical SAM protein [Thermodesulforhabdus norvegica]|uniref:Radical SAM superfamily protein n=1 Tax=Thermodesulforhabdus norvegica TaxID=39841 RepID=A0A1I4T787_9BACT|nr:radical SAM protein [Thermodesulforhabdus norvegica]SFM72592.1 Radical SAM superfamily protein [Thermodesulforhabdus norvegica]